MSEVEKNDTAVSGGDLAGNELIGAEMNGTELAGTELAGTESTDTAMNGDGIPITQTLPRRRKSLFRLKRDWPIVVLVSCLILGWVAYACVYPAIDIRHRIATSKWKMSPSDPEISYQIKFVQRTVEYCFVFWFFYLGASIGSFINVVASRTPRGKTIVTRGSHCPFCDTALSMIDNSPVFGWILLRGRCRACRIPISPRYLIMEIVVGSCFMILGAVELIGNGVNLPYRDWQFGAGIVSTVFYPKWDLIGAFVVHCGFFAVCLMLIGSQLDRLRFPALPLSIMLVIVMCCVVALRPLGPIGWQEPFGPRLARFPHPIKDLIFTTVLGALAGLCLGMGTRFGLRRLLQNALIQNTLMQNVQTRSIDVDGVKREVEFGSSEGDEMTASSDSALIVASEGSAEDAGDVTNVPDHAKGALLGWGRHWLFLHVLAGALFGWQGIAVASLIASLGVLFTCGSASKVGSANGKRGGMESPKPVLMADVLALAILTITLFVHLCTWRWVVQLWQFS